MIGSFVCEGIRAISYYVLDQHEVAMCHRFHMYNPSHAKLQRFT